MSPFNITHSLQTATAKIFAFLPALLGAILFLVLGYVIAKILQKIVQKALGKPRFDRAWHVSPAGKFVYHMLESKRALLRSFSSYCS